MYFRRENNKREFKIRRYRGVGKELLYPGCFVIAMIAGVSLANYLDRVAFLHKPNVNAMSGANMDRVTQSPDISAKKGAESAENTGSKEPVTALASSNTQNMPIASESTQINEQFNGASLNTNLWTAMNRPAGYRNHEEQAYASLQVAVRDGQLVITAQRDQSGAWVSGEVNSKWAYRYGDFEVRARLSANGAGVWPAAWLFNNAGIWPDGGEIDMYESINSEMSVYGTIHAGGTDGNWQKQTGVYNIDPRDYHVYKISKQPGVISWWVDGVERAVWRKDALSSGQTWPFDDFDYIGLLNLAIGGDWPGPSNANTPSKIEYYIDYFTVKNAR